jgi:hypothetical protein
LIVTSLAGLSSRSPLNDAWRSIRSFVHDVNSTSLASGGHTKANGVTIKDCPKTKSSRRSVTSAPTPLPCCVRRVFARDTNNGQWAANCVRPRWCSQTLQQIPTSRSRRASSHSNLAAWRQSSALRVCGSTTSATTARAICSTLVVRYRTLLANLGTPRRLSRWQFTPTRSPRRTTRPVCSTACCRTWGRMLREPNRNGFLFLGVFSVFPKNQIRKT